MQILQVCIEWCAFFIVVSIAASAGAALAVRLSPERPTEYLRAADAADLRYHLFHTRWAAVREARNAVVNAPAPSDGVTRKVGVDNTERTSPPEGCNAEPTLRFWNLASGGLT